MKVATHISSIKNSVNKGLFHRGQHHGVSHGFNKILPRRSFKQRYEVNLSNTLFRLLDASCDCV